MRKIIIIKLIQQKITRQSETVKYNITALINQATESVQAVNKQKC